MDRRKQEIIGVIKRIFEVSGYQISSEQIKKFDFCVQKLDKRLAVRVMASKNLIQDSHMLLRIAKELVCNKAEDYSPVVVTLSMVSEEQKNAVCEDNDIHILDIRNLLYLLSNHDSIKNELLSFLDYSVRNLLPQPDSIVGEKVMLLASPEQEEWIEDNRDVRKIDGLIEFLLDKERVKLQSSTMFERVCVDILKLLFVDDLALWKEQQKSNDGLFRFDLLCKIKNGNEKEFWRMAEFYFQSKYIVFEFKNYTQKVTQKEIFTTVKYLYTKALRCVAIMVSPNGTDENAEKAIRGILREEGKLIISLSVDDLVDMLRMKRDNEDPASYFSDKLDELLIDLEK